MTAWPEPFKVIVISCVITVGFITSWTVTIAVSVATFPLTSVTVKVTVLAPTFEQTKDKLFNVIVSIPQLSVEPSLIIEGVIVAKPFEFNWIVISWVITLGSSTSVTTTFWVAVAVFPNPSVTVQVTIVVPNRKTAGALELYEATVQLSATIGVPKATPVAVHPVFVFIATSAGALIVGLVTSKTVVIVYACEIVHPLASVAVTV